MYYAANCRPHDEQKDDPGSVTAPPQKPQAPGRYKPQFEQKTASGSGRGPQATHSFNRRR